MIKNKIGRLLVFSILVFNILVSSTSVFAKESLVTIDLKAENQENIDFSNRKLKFWKISPQSEEIDKESIITSLNDLANEDLDSKYSQAWESPLSDKTGKISIFLEEGTYYAKEIDTYHSVKIYPFIFIVKKDENINIIPKGENPSPPGEVELIKISNNGKRLAGAKFELYSVKGNEIKKVPLKDNYYNEEGLLNYSLVTNSKGEIQIYNLPSGDYIFKEIEAPDGYIIREEETNFTISSDKITRIEIVNFKEGQGGIKFRKISEDGQALAKAKFKLTRKIGDSYESLKLDNKDYIVESSLEGYFIIEGISYGEYYLWEVQPPKGYSALSGPVKFVVDRTSFDKVISIEDKKIPDEPTKNSPQVPPENPLQNSPIIIPKTGDITLILMSLIGIAFAISGYRLIKENSVD